MTLGLGYCKLDIHVLCVFYSISCLALYDDENDEGKLEKFHRIMIGKRSNTGSSSDPFLTVERRNISPAILSQCFQRAKTEQAGLTFHLATFMIDLLKRRCNLRALTNFDELEKASDGKVTVESIAEHFDDVADYCEFKHKELLISLLETCPKKYWSRLMSLAAQVGHPCPFLYPMINSQGRTQLKLIPEAYSDLLCLPDDPLVLSCGVSSCVGKGKTELLSVLFGFLSDTQDTALERHPGGPCHDLSIDFAFQGVINKNLDTFVVADAHGSTSDSNEFAAALSILASGAVLTFIHVTSNDFSEDGEPSPEVVKFLRCCSSKISGKKCCIMILWRDFSKVKHEEDKMKKAESNLRTFCPWLPDVDRMALHHFGVPNITKLNELKRGILFKRLSENASDKISQCNEGGSLKKMPTAKALRTNCGKLLSSAAHQASSVTSSCIQNELDSIGDEVHCLLNATADQCGQHTLFEILFPASTIDSRLAELNERGERITRDRTLDRKAYQELDNIEEQLTELENQQAKCVVSDLVNYFAHIAVSGKVEAVQEFNRQLNIWKEPRCRPYVEKRSKLHSDLEKRITKLRKQEAVAEFSSVTELKQQGSARAVEESDVVIQQIKKAILMNADELDRYDISIDDVWSEVMSLSTHCIRKGFIKIPLLQLNCGVVPAAIQSTYCDCVIAGHPMQLLRGRPLYMAGDFLSSVLLSIQQEPTRRLFVVSVIGMQSSAKSTLLNYLFGCGFATRAGRCTRGLYASYMRTHDVDVIILDSEGLMSVEGGSKDFDTEVALMAMACSHIVIINQKGEIHRQLRELLEVSLFALRHLKESVLRLSPDVVFVLRDQAELDPKALEKQFYDMRETLTDQGGKLNIEVNEFIDLSSEALYLFPPAFDMKNRKEKTFKEPSALFSERVLDLRKDLFKRHDFKLRAPGGDSKEFSSMQSWLNHAKSVWTSIRKYGGNLVYYESMHEIQQRQAVARIFEEIVNEKLEQVNGYNAKCEKLFNDHISEDPLEVTSGRVGEGLKKSLRVAADAANEEVTDLLNEKLQGHNYPLKFSQEFKQKLLWRIREKSDTVFASWTAFETKMKAATEPERIEALLRTQMDSLFRQRGSGMPQRELEFNFERMWKDNVGKVKCSFSAQWLTDGKLAKEINTLFASQVAVNKDKNVYTVLRTNLKQIPNEESLMLRLLEEEWGRYIISNTWWITRQLRKVAIKVAKESKTRISAPREAHKRVVSFFLSQQLGCMFTGDWKLDTSFMGKVLSMTVDMILKFDLYLETMESGRVAVEKPIFANNVHDCLRRRIFNEYRERRDRDLKDRYKELDKLKMEVQERIVIRLCGQEDDRNRSSHLVKKVLGGLRNRWLLQKVAIFRDAVATELQHTETAEEAAKDAFDMSFRSRNWEGVKEYCSNAPAYLQSIYSERFKSIATTQKVKALHEVKTVITAAVQTFDEQVAKWGASAAPENTTTKSLTSYCTRSMVDLQLVHYVDEDIEVSNPEIFAHAFRTAFQELATVNELSQEADELFEEQLQEVNVQIWDRAQGCSEVCPLCNAKCTRERANHFPPVPHDCKIHLFPAFGGVRWNGTDKPVFGICTSKENVNSLYIKPSDKDGKFRPLAEHYKKYYPDWVVPKEAIDFTNEGILRRAWLHTKDYFLEKYNMVDDTPSDWVILSS